jgi:signal transduction histidine kinase
LESISAIAAEIGRSVERSELRTQAEQALIAEERQRLARDLHDSITQLLCGQALLAEASRSFVRSGNPVEAEPYLDQLVETAHQALKEMRLMIYNLRPSVLAAEGLVGAIDWRLEAVEQRAGIKGQLTGEITSSLSKQEEEGLYRVVQELLNNVLKHAGAATVKVTLRDTPDGVEVEVIDDGKGFDPAACREGIGLKSVRERMERLGGTLHVTTRPGQGCRVLARLRPASGAC